jgi:alpha-L-rhamnosidase
MKKILVFLAAALLTFSCGQSLIDAPADLKIEYGSTVLDVSLPRFSWIIQDDSRGAVQTAYQIIVATDVTLLTEKKADTWNSGKIESDQSVFVEYYGEIPDPGKRYYWTVKVWNAFDEASAWTSPAFFDVGLLNPDLWKAQWVGCNESIADADSLRPKSIYLRNEFQLENNIRSAKLYASGLGSYQFFLNGEKVSDDLLTPGWTDYPSRIQYQVYDVKEYLKKGDNTAGFLLGNMWYSSGLGWRGGTSYSKGPMKAIMQMEVEYVNGEKEMYVSDDNWTWHFSPILENTIYHGEFHDARLEIDGWNRNGLDESDWQSVTTYNRDENITLSAQFSPTIQVTREITPRSINKLDNGSYVFDIGYNMTGSIRLNVEGEAGTEITMKFAELLHEDGSVAQENLRSAIATDHYILKGSGAESWEPSFTYHGFRYIEISGLPAEPDSSTVLGLNFHNAAPETGTFRCSNETLNSIQANIENGQRSNMFSVPTDCPQRDERLGWMGDAQVFAATSCYNMDMSGFYAKWVRDISDSQDEEGWVTDVNPVIVVTGPAKPAWGDAFIVVPWEMYRFYGDKRIFELYFEDYAAWVNYMTSKSEDNLYIYDADGWGGYGDWISVVKSDPQPISAAYYYFSSKLLSKFASLIDNIPAAEKYGSLAETIRTAFNEKYFDEEKFNYPGGTQTSMLLPMNFGITEEEHLTEVAANLAKDVEERGKHPSTGFLGTKYILPTLSDYGYHQLAYETATSIEYPSWGYMIENGATSMWELWNSDSEKPEGMNSRNHFALGSIGEWFYTHLAGIRIDDANPGFKHSIVAPMPAKGLDWVKGSIMTPYGPLKSAWEIENEKMWLHVTIPANTTSTIKIPVLSDKAILLSENGVIVVKEDGTSGDAEGIDVVSIDEKQIVLNVGAGKYEFELTH